MGNSFVSCSFLKKTFVCDQKGDKAAEDGGACLGVNLVFEIETVDFTYLDSLSFASLTNLPFSV